MSWSPEVIDAREIPTPGGLKTSRRADIIMTAPDWSLHIEQVGLGRKRLDTDGHVIPIKREREARLDLAAAYKQFIHFTGYGTR